MIENYYYNYKTSIISSKLILKKQFIFPKIRKIEIFFIISIKYYNKIILLLYLLIHVCFFASILLYNKEKNNYQILKLFLYKKKIINFLNNFISVYLPVFEIDQNTIKKSITPLKNKKNFIYRIIYSNFPVLPEIDFLCYSNEHISNIISLCQIVLDFYLKKSFFIKNSLNFLLRLFRLPIVLKIINF